MKTTKYLTVLIGLIVGLSMTFTDAANAQQQATADGNASVDILETDLVIEHQRDLYFGEHVPSSEIDVHVSPTEDNGHIPGGAVPAEFNLEGEEDTTVLLTIDAAGPLTNENGTEIDVTLDVAGDKNDSRSEAEDELAPGGDEVQLSDESGRYWFWIGGDITIEPNQQNGHYETDLLVEAEYTM